MRNNKTKVECCLITRGTDKANANAVDDLSVQDPEQVVGKKVIEEAMEKDSEHDGKSENS